MKIKFLLPVLAFFMLSSCSNEEFKVRIDNDLIDPRIKYALGQLKTLEDKGQIKLSKKSPDLIVNSVIDTNLEDEAYSIKVDDLRIDLRGGDASGLMYGLLHIKEELESGKREIQNISESPRFTFRALKFNLPWDSYRRGVALQLHYETCQDTLFWSSFLDMMAENRFNKLTLWNLHPFNYLVKTEKYPEACGFSDEEMAEWEKFWTSLFRMAKERGIETYLMNWNIFVSPEFAKAHNVAEYCIKGDYFIEQGDTSEIVKDYTREAVKEVIDKYPDLSGLGITLGEGMGGMTPDEREEWILEAFVDGMRMASRKIKFIHRVPISADRGSAGSITPYLERMTRETLDTLSCVEGPIDIELKFNWSHGHSCPELVKVHGGTLSDTYWIPGPENYKLDWMIRNEDFFALRWGQPDFIREHISLNGQSYVNGYFIGSECYIPAKDYITSLPNTSYKYAFERQWMFYKQWGRLLYNPQTPDTYFAEAFDERFPGVGKDLFDAQTRVSSVPLIIASYWNATWDYTLYSEGMLSLMGHDSMKLIGLAQMSEKHPMDPQFMSIPEFLANDKKAKPGMVIPFQLADSIYSLCSESLNIVENLDSENNNDLLYEISDIQSWAYLGLYFANKLRAAVYYREYQLSGNKSSLSKAYSLMKVAASNWHQLVEITTPIYDPMPLQHYERNGHKLFHWSVVEEEVLAELEWLKGLE